jgi:protein-disulfide isomerase
MAGWRDAAIAGVLGAVVGAAAVMVAHHTGAGEDKAAIGRIVHDYVLDHPEILPEAMHRLEERRSAKLVVEHRKAIERPFGGAWAGAPDGDVTLVEFTDFACGFCRATLPAVTKLLAEDPKLKVIYREIPILSPASTAAAKVALAAGNAERYGVFRRNLYAAGPPTAENIAAAAASAAIDPNAGNGAAISAEIDNNLALARALGIGGTPSFVIGDRMISGAVGYDALKEAVDAARKNRG